MDLGVLDGQTRGDYFLDSIFDPSMNQCIQQSYPFNDCHFQSKYVTKKVILILAI